jgi:NADH-quinone oxidoreductase subunit J
VASGRPAPLAGPGTYARHNAVDMPALLPDGTPSQASVPAAIRGEPETPDQQRTLLGSSAAVRGATGSGESGDHPGQEGDA